MATVNYFYQTRVYQEAFEEGLALSLIRLKRPIREIVEATGLTAVQVRKLKKSPPSVTAISGRRKSDYNRWQRALSGAGN
jgi:hypothetical protein